MPAPPEFLTIPTFRGPPPLFPTPTPSAPKGRACPHSPPPRPAAHLILSLLLLLFSTLLLASPTALLAAPTAIIGATLLTVSHGDIENGVLVFDQGRITRLGPAEEVAVPEGAHVIEARGKYLMPGIVDTHSHMGVYPWPRTASTADGNEAIHPLTPHVRAEDAFYLEDPALERARAGGVTTVQVLPGSANLMGGFALVLKLRQANTLDEMRFEGAPPQMKMAFGENPKRVYGGRRQPPSTRMGNAAGMREALARAREYGERWEEHRRMTGEGKPYPRPEYDPKSEALLKVLRGEVRLHIHCYRKDGILGLMRIADEFGLKIASFQHALEAYKVAGEIARRDIGVATFADWWGYKWEAWDAIPYNAGLLARAGVRVAIHSDSADLVQRLYHEAAKAVHYGMSADAGLKAITLWPASILGLEDRIGSLDVGKDADLALFSRHPYDIYTEVLTTWIDGEVVHDARP